MGKIVIFTTICVVAAALYIEADKFHLLDKVKPDVLRKMKLN